MKTIKLIVIGIILSGSVQMVLAQTKIYSCRIVDFGADLGSGYYRNTPTTQQTTYKEDVDSDGNSLDDCIAFWKFSLTEPLNPSTIYYEKEATNTIFYGGLTAYFDQPNYGLTEGMINENHEDRDDFNMMNANYVTSLRHRDYGFWFWKKENFLNGGDVNTVTFDANSKIVVHISRYWTGIEGARWVVQDGTQFYISKAIFQGVPIRSSHVLRPDTTQWAPYNPSEPYKIEFNATSAVWSSHAFTNVTSVGFYFFRDNLVTGNMMIKWHAFEVYANVTRLDKPSFHNDMVQIPAGGSITNPFNISSKEVDYLLWQKVWRWAVSNQYCRSLGMPGYVFDKDGDMGSMDVGSVTHVGKEPATDMTWYDAVLWCNALSELEGYTPCYYEDAAKTNILRLIKERTDSTQYNTKKYHIYVNYSANGYRLPTLEEWTASAAEAPSDAASAWIAANSGNSTHPVGLKNANSLGLYDMIGNVWEYCWDVAAASDHFDPTIQMSHSAIGGSFMFPDATADPIKKWGDIPWRGNPNIGFRIVRANTGAVPPSSQNYGSLPVWTYSETTKNIPSGSPAKISNIVENDMVKISGTKEYKTTGDPLYENDNTGFVRSDDAVITVTPFYLSKYETSYDKWCEILNWGEINGYVFDSDGDMGCMDYRVSTLYFKNDEPVTDVTWNDMHVWCNALSEYEGKTPVYYSDSARTKVIKKGCQWRIAMDRSLGYPSYLKFNLPFTRYEKDGYRLPLEAEWEVAYRNGIETKNYGVPANAGTNSWLSTNSGDSTHAVTSGSPNGYGIYNLSGNVCEWINGARGYNFYYNHNPKDGLNEPLYGMTLRGGNFGSSAAPNAFDYKQGRASAPRAYIGFRASRCDLNEHPDSFTFTPDVKISYNPNDYDPLEGRTFHNNLHRTGEFKKAGVPVSDIVTKWTFTTGGPVQSSPVAVDTILYIGSDDDYVYAINTITGKEIWKYKTGGDVKSSATVYNNAVFIGSNDGYLYSINALSGALNWKKKAYTSGIVSTPPTVLYNTVFATWSNMWEPTNNVGLDISNGDELWRYRFSSSSQNGGAITADTNLLIFATGDNISNAVNISTEMNKWYSNGYHNAGSMPMLNSSTVLYNSEYYIKALNKNTGSKIWELSIGTNTEGFPYSTPATGMIDSAGTLKKTIFWATLKKTIHAINENGTIRWAKNFSQPFKSSPALANNVVYTGCDDSTLYAVSALDGSIIWSYKTGSRVFSSPWVDDGVVFAGSDDGKVYAIAANNLPVIKATPASVIVSNTSGATSITIENSGMGDLNWTVSENSSWFSLSPLSGTNTTVVSITYDANLGNVRYDTITITAAGALVPVVKIPVEQNGVTTTPNLSVSDTVFNVTKDAGTVSFDISNSGNGSLNWSITGGAAWLSVSKYSGTGNQNITVNYTANSNTARIATITISAPGALNSPRTVVITQASGVSGLNDKDCKFGLYPNPAYDDITLSSDENITRVVITNLAGQVMIQKGTNISSIIDIRSLSKGFYILEVYSGDESLGKTSFVKQ